MNFVFSHAGEIFWRLGQHIVLTAGTLLIACVIALPLGIAAAANRRVAGIVLALLDLTYTIPSLALYALLIPLMGLGFATAATALTVYAQTILVRSVVTGLSEVPSALRDVARGLGMSSLQSLVRVELPYAMPTLLGGMRVAAVTLIAMANLAAWINGGGLGSLIFYGLEHDDANRIVVGSLCSIFLVLPADALFRRLESHAVKRRNGCGARL
jgi:osmoprotectant transport system permease protein